MALIGFAWDVANTDNPTGMEGWLAPGAPDPFGIGKVPCVGVA